MGMGHMDQPRRPPGTPEGGQWAPTAHDEADISLDAGTVSVLQRRAREVEALGFVPAAAIGSALRRTGVGAWWGSHWALAEHGPEGATYPAMPDDETPLRSLGRSRSGHRRTHRMAYAGAGVEVRMPSVAAVRRYASRLSGGTGQEAVTFDIPVSAVYPDGEVSGWVRATCGADGTWATRALGAHDEGAHTKAGEYVAESVQCLLEARRPSRALREVGDLLERRRQRRVSTGVKLAPARSSWVRKTGYDYATGTLLVSTGRHNYGYRASERSYQVIANTWSPGRAFNLLVRGKAQRVDVVECDKCGRYSAQIDGAGKHRCPPQEASPQAMSARAALLERRDFDD
jgi:hypothetical protein